MSSKNQAGRGAAKAKAEHSEKVKEIKRKQQNWMKQREREESQSRKDGSGDRARSASVHHTPVSSPQIGARVPPSPRPGARARSRPNQDTKFGLSYVVKPGGSSKESGYDSENSSTHQHEDYKYNGASAAATRGHSAGHSRVQQSSKPPVHKTKKTGFHEWIKHRQESLEKMSQDGSSTPSELGGNQERVGSVLDRVELDTGDMSDYTVSSSSQHHRLEPDQMEDLAEKVLRRVKSELNLNANGSKKSLNNDVETSTHSKVDSSEASERKSRGLDSHYCSKCGKLMMPPRHDVMMIIPCGHNICRKCVNELEHCCTCSCDIRSSTNNIMLQKVINDYSKTISSAARGARGSSRRSRPDSAAGGVYTPHTYTDRTNYKEDLASIQIRMDGLESEVASISSHLQQLQRDLSSEKSQTTSLNSEEQRTRDEITSLQKRLAEIASRRTESETRTRRLEQSYSDDLRRLHSLQQSLQSLTTEKEKIKLLVGTDD